MAEILETVMLICFGLSWPISVYKSATSHSTKGKSVFFLVAIMLGYLAGIGAKILSGNVNYVLGLYVFNLVIVSCDFVLYFVNKRRERHAEVEYAK